MNKFKSFLPNTNIYVVISSLLMIVIFMWKDKFLGFLLLAIFILVLVYIRKTVKEKEKDWNEFLENNSKSIDRATHNTLKNLPFPMMILDENGEITWYNKKFLSVFNLKDILGQNIIKLISNFNTKDVIKSKVSSYEYVNILDEYYDVYTNIVNIDEDYGANRTIIILYFYQVTSYKKNVEYREGIMLIEVDNLDEVIKGTEENKRPILIAEIERFIMNYASSINAMIKKYASNKYILSVKDSVIKEEMNKKFDVLDKIREIDLGNKLNVTLSIGIGRMGENPMINNTYANSAKELALGRGGDQAVVKSGEKLDFFGGKAKEFEKRTKVRARVIAHALRDLIEESSNVYIMGHRNPDMDAFGSAIGLTSVARNLGKQCRIVLEESNNSIKYILDKMNNDNNYNGWVITPNECLEELDENSLLILVDVHSRSYVQNEEIVNNVKSLVIIDHHRRTVDFIEGAILTYIEIYASSTSELVTEMIQYMLEKPKLTQLEAEALLAGICIDTKNFFLKTGVRTFEAASFLRRLGADTIDVKKMFGHDLSSYIKKFEIIKNAVVENNIAIAVSPGNIQETVVGAQAADELLNITGIQASFVLVRIKDDIFISGRSFGDINVQLILEALGGGGHLTIAGAKLTNITNEEAVERLKDAINKYSREGE